MATSDNFPPPSRPEKIRPAMVNLAEVRNETRGKSALYAKPYLLDGIVMLSGAKYLWLFLFNDSAMTRDSSLRSE
jgi:hypothetical protein